MGVTYQTLAFSGHRVLVIPRVRQPPTAPIRVRLIHPRRKNPKGKRPGPTRCHKGGYFWKPVSLPHPHCSSPAFAPEDQESWAG